MSLQQAIFDEITTFEKPLDCVSLRRFTQSNKIYLTEPHTIGFPKASSDFTLDEGSAQGTRWCDRSGFVEIKASVRDTPEVVRAAPDGSTVKGIVVQASNYARLHLAGSPFQLFSLGMLIFGMKFSVGFFDRGGVTLSPIYDVLDSTGYFIRVVRQITEVSRITLGRDPSVRELLDDGPDDDDLSILSTTSHPMANIPSTTYVSVMQRKRTISVGAQWDHQYGPPYLSSAEGLRFGVSLL